MADAVDLAAFKSPEVLESVAEQLTDGIVTGLSATESPINVPVELALMVAQTLAMIALSKRLGRLTDVIKLKR